MSDAILKCNTIELGCEICYTYTSTYDSIMYVSLNLPINTSIYAWVTDKFGNQYSYNFTTNLIGQFVLNTSDFIEGMFNPDAGTFDVFFTTDELGSDIITFTAYSKNYTCLKFNTTCEEMANYKVYTALLSQSNTDAPTAIVLENTIGDIVWSYDGAGSYIATLAGAFTTDKTFVICNATNGSNNVIIQASTPFMAQDVILLYSWNSGTLSNDVLVNTPIEIRVYP